MLKFEVQVVDPSTGLPPPKRLKFSAQVTGVEGEGVGSIRFIDSVDSKHVPRP